MNINPNANEETDITWRDAWDAEQVVADLHDLANRLARGGRYEDSSLLLMAAQWIEEESEKK